MDRNAHGGDWAGRGLSRPSRADLDFSASVSPLGVPRGVLRAVRRAAGYADAYPDPQCRRLRAAIGAAHGLPAEQVLCGNGAIDLIYRAAFTVLPRRAVVTAPSFSGYEAALDAVEGVETDRFPLRPENGFLLDERFLPFLTDGTDLCFLCQPNNPTGRTIPRPLLVRILDRCRDIGCLLVLDECFLPFLDRPEDFTALNLLNTYRNLLILRSFTKLYGLAGLRLGYALSSDLSLLRDMERNGPPWSVSLVAQEAGLAALGEAEYVRRVRELTARERVRLAAGLTAAGLRETWGEANFLLFRSPVPLEGPLEEKNIYLRNCGSFPGLDGSWYRAAVRTGRENGKLLSALGNIRELRRAGWWTAPL